jgi:hypothetical protein
VGYKVGFDMVQAAKKEKRRSSNITWKKVAKRKWPFANSLTGVVVLGACPKIRLRLRLGLREKELFRQKPFRIRSGVSP